VRNRATWRSVRFAQGAIERDLRQRHTLWLHGACIGTLVVAAMWLVSALQLRLGSGSLALRYLVTLGVGYLAYLLLLRLWAGALAGRQAPGDPGLDLPSAGQGRGDGTGCVEVGAPRVELPALRSGGGGDFGGGGASGDFDGGQALGQVAEDAFEVAAGADEGAVVVIPVVAVFLVGAAVLFGAGSLLLLYFGSEALLAVAIELAFGYAAGRTALRVSREGWIGAAVRLTWKPLLGALACAVLLGASIDHFIPDARSLPHAVALMARAR
jgi:hypothetical protein